ncbi:MAG TPA: TlpA disulfide reductase family protein [Bryobacteraceae bacterium]|nr:TlpA disulfide reductase family protein [Bryobacteraceae bacterium]
MRLFLCLTATISVAGLTCYAASRPGCEARPEVRQILRTKLEESELDRLKFPDRAAREHQVLEDLIAQYPDEIQSYRRLINFVRNSEPEQFPALQDRFRKQAAAKPADPVAAYVAAVALFRTDTPESIRLLETARASSSDFAWTALELANIYSSGKRVDKKKAAEDLALFFSMCPTSTDRTAQWLLGKLGDVPFQARVAGALREQLAKETDPVALRAYETLWGLEFRTRPPLQHAALREQVKADLKRLEALDVKGDVKWIALLKNGYKQTGDLAATAALDDRLLREFPTSEEAYGAAYERWDKMHKKPADHKDAPAWAAYNAAHKDALKGWIREFTDSTYLSRSAWFFAIFDDDTISEKEGNAALDHFLKAEADYDPPASWQYENAAEFLIDHKWQPKRALELLHRAQPLLAAESNRDLHDDNLSADEAEQRANREVYDRQEITGMVLQAARLAGRPAEGQALRASVEAAPPTQKKRESGYWLNRARLAALENRKADALTYYQLALQTRLSPPNPWRGKLQDDLADESRALWKEMGGTEVAYAIWSKPTAEKPQELKEGRWEKPKKTLPAFELTDLSGKTWKLVALEGKSVFINLWATWCGPCSAELPHLEDLYKKVKDRTDVQILTFNLDEDLGLVEPYMKDKGYTFPVLPAFSLVMGLLDGVGIPQNWIVDPRGKWRWTQLGFGGEPDWGGDMIQRLEQVKNSEAAVPSSSLP